MNPKKLGILAAVAVVLGGIAYMTSREPADTTPEALGKTVLGELDVNAVEKITLTTPTATTTVARAGDKWVLANRYDYPVDFGKVRDILIDLSELKVGQVIEVSDTRRKSLKLAPPKAGDEDTGMLLELYGEGAGKIASLLIGETRKRKTEDAPGDGYPDGRYVSTDGGETAYLVKETLTQLSETPTDWLDTEICNVSSSDIEDIRIAGPARPKLTFTKKDGSLKLAGVRDEEELETSKMYSIESALSYLRLEDIADPALGDDVTGMNDPVVFTANTKKGEIYSARVGNKVADGDKRYLRLAVALKPAEPEPAPPEDEDEEAKKKREKEAEKKANERTELEATVAELNAKLAPWTFVIESYKSDNLAITRDKLVKLKEKEKEDDDGDKKDGDKPEAKIEGIPGKVETAKPAPKPEPKPEVKPTPAPKPAPPVPEPTKPEVKPAPKAAAKPKSLTPPTVVTEPVAVPPVTPKPAPAPKPVEKARPAAPEKKADK